MGFEDATKSVYACGAASAEFTKPSPEDTTANATRRLFFIGNPSNHGPTLNPVYDRRMRNRPGVNHDVAGV
jgi:hypothetical protein